MSPTPLTKLPGFVEHLAEKVHNLSTGTFTLALSNTPPTGQSPPPSNSTSACVLANVTQISYANLSSRTLTTSVVQSGETVVLRANNIALTATGAVPTFRWVYVYNASTTLFINALLGYYDLGTGGVTLGNGDTLTITFDPNEGILSIGGTYGIYYSSWIAQTYGWESLSAIDWWAE